MAIHVEFRNADDALIGTVRLRGGRAVFDDRVDWVKDVLVRKAGNPKVLEPEDGEAYLRALPDTFTSGYHHAVLIS